jgi:Ca2+-binding RTX toxin-like protein
MRVPRLRLPRYESLERRRLLSAEVAAGGVLVVTGTEADDTIVVSADATTILVNENGVETAFDRAVVSALHMMGLGGNDMLQVLNDDGTFTLSVFSEGGAGDDFIDGAGGNDQLEGGDGNDFIFGYEGDDTIVGGAGQDFLVGVGGNDLIAGGADADVVFGGEGNDSLFGDDGDDQLNGDAGNDDLDGGLGADTMDGGEDADRYMVPDETDTMVMDGLDIVYVPPPPPPPPPPEEEPCDPENPDKNPNWKRGHCHKHDDLLVASTMYGHGKKLGHAKHGR